MYRNQNSKRGSEVDLQAVDSSRVIDLTQTKEKEPYAMMMAMMMISRGHTPVNGAAKKKQRVGGTPLNKDSDDIEGVVSSTIRSRDKCT